MLNNVDQLGARVTLEFVTADAGALNEAWSHGDLQARLIEALGQIAANLDVTVNLEIGEQAIDERLLQPAMSLFSEVPTDPATSKIISRIDNKFPDEGILTVRDVLATGKRKIAAIESFGPKFTDVFDAALAGQDYGVEWGPDPTARTVATLYRGLNEVPLRVLGYSPTPLFQTVGDLISQSEESVVDALPQRYGPPVRLAKEMLTRAKRFATDFNVAHSA